MDAPRDYSDAEPALTDNERKKLREILEGHEHRRWLRDIAKAWGGWLTAVGGALAMVKIAWDHLVQNVIGKH